MKSVIFLLVWVTAGGPCAWASDNVLDKTGHVIKKGGDAAGRGVEKGLDATGRGIRKGGKAVGKGLDKAGEKLDKVFKK